MALQFQLVKIDAPQFAILNDGEFTNPLQINFELNFAVDSSFTSIKTTLKAVYLTSSEPVMQLVVECYYAISKEGWQEMTQENNTIIVPVGFLQHLATITVGTTRGVLFARTVETNLNKFVLPLVNVTEMVKQDMVITPQPETEKK